MLVTSEEYFLNAFIRVCKKVIGASVYSLHLKVDAKGSRSGIQPMDPNRSKVKITIHSTDAKKKRAGNPLKAHVNIKVV